LKAEARDLDDLRLPRAGHDVGSNPKAAAS
jgi:hypothetical protein